MTALREIAETSMDRKHEIDALRAENAKLREALDTLLTKYWLNEDAYDFVKKTQEALKNE